MSIYPVHLWEGSWAFLPIDWSKDKNKSILYGTILGYTSNMRKLLAAIILNDFPFSLSFSVHPFKDQYFIPMGYTLSGKKEYWTVPFLVAEVPPQGYIFCSIYSFLRTCSRPLNNYGPFTVQFLNVHYTLGTLIIPQQRQGNVQFNIILFESAPGKLSIFCIACCISGELVLDK